MKIFNDNTSIGRGFSRIDTTETKMGTYDHGAVFTPHGIVYVYAQGDDINNYHSNVEMVHRDLHRVRNFAGKRYSKRGLSKMAREFAREIITQ